MDKTVLDGNRAVRGGAIFQTGGSAAAQVTNSLFYGNAVSEEFGAGIRREAGTFNLDHVTLANNVGGSGFSGVANQVYNTIAWDNDGYPGFAVAPTTADCNIDDGGNAGIDVDPLFISPGTNYFLLPNSPAIDACSTGLPTDLIGRTRPVGTGYDMGAFEWANLPPVGLHEGASGDVWSMGCSVSGWTMDPNVPDRVVQVSVLSGTIPVVTGSANLYREDLLDICPDGTCGFYFDLWGLIPINVENAITVRAYDEESDDWWELEGTPKMLNCRQRNLYLPLLVRQ
ncbi:MAG: choice-of-anchor Q domain-containing protein [Anaerolineales bacterium]